MRSEQDLRAALRLLEREAPSAQTVLRHVRERAGRGTAARDGGGRPMRRLLAAAAAAAAVIAIVTAAVLAANRPAGHSPALTHHSASPSAYPSPSPSVRPSPSPSPSPSSRAVPDSLPRYYMAVVPGRPSLASPHYALVRDAISGKTLATVRPPKPYVTFISVTGAADDRTFVLTAQSATSSNPGTRIGFYEARFDPADNKLTVSPLALRGLPGGIDLAGAALSPDGGQLAVASQTGGIGALAPGSVAQIAVYSLPGGAVRAWRADGNFANTGADLLTWGGTGTLAFSWGGASGPPVARSSESAFGFWLLNTHGPGGALFTYSRQPFCSAQGSSLLNASYAGYLTPDGSTIISSVLTAVPAGQRPVCPGAVIPTPSAGSPAMPRSVFEEFSAATGKAIRAVPSDPSRAVAGNIWWSNASGSALVVNASARPGGPDDFGVLSGGRFTPIPGAPSMGENPTMIAF
jgi:hypothetical protein